MASTVPAGFRASPLSIAQLTLSAVLKCGQSFRWYTFPLFSAEDALATESGTTPTHEYRFCLKDRVVCLRQSADTLFYQSVYPRQENIASTSTDEARKDDETLAFIRDYFQLDTDLLNLYEEWSGSDPVFRNLRERFAGIRMLRQDPWECLISFICSSNNNISRISKMVSNLCSHFSPPLLSLTGPRSSNDHTASTGPYHAFPPPSALAAPTVSAKLRSLGFGYRADFIQKTAAMLLEAHGSDDKVYSFLVSLRKMDSEDAREELMKLMGVGRKVADCVLLMSLDKREVVPVDTHVYQIATKHYGLQYPGKGKVAMSPKLYDEVNKRLTRVWGSYAGWAHSVLFTADLKAFENYNSQTPSPVASPTKSPQGPLAGHATVPESPTKKRRRTQATSLSTGVVPDLSIVKIEAISSSSIIEETSLADRVKKRTRVSKTLKRETMVDC